MGPDDAEEKEVPSQEIWDADFYVSENGKPRVHIVTAYMAAFEKADTSYTIMKPDTVSHPRSVKAEIYDATGRLYATMESGTLYHFERSGNYEARGNVRVVTPEGRKLEGEQLFWNQANRKIHSPGFVRIVTPTEKIQGYGLFADENIENYTLARVTGEFEVEDE